MTLASFVLRQASSCTTVRAEVEKAREQQAENELWAKTPGAREVLAQPVFDLGLEGSSGTLDSLDCYLQVRPWGLTCRFRMSSAVTPHSLA